MIRVALADRESLFVQALAHLAGTETDLVINGRYTDGDALFDGLDSTPADVVLMDPIGLTPMGMEVIRQVLASFPDTKVVVLTANQQEQQLFAAVRAGARGYLLKGADQEQIRAAIRAAANGEIIAVGEAYESKASAKNGIESVQKNATGAAVVDLTE